MNKSKGEKRKITKSVQKQQILPRFSCGFSRSGKAFRAGNDEPSYLANLDDSPAQRGRKRKDLKKDGLEICILTSSIPTTKSKNAFFTPNETNLSKEVNKSNQPQSKKKSENIISIIAQSAHQEQKGHLEIIRKLESETNMFRIHLAQAQNELKEVKKDSEERIHKAKEEVRVLQSQLAGTRTELKAVEKESEDKINLKVKEVMLLRSQLAGTQTELEAVKQVSEDKIDLAAAIKELEIQLAEKQQELDTVKESNQVNSFQQNLQEKQKEMKFQFYEIRMLLVKNLGLTGMNLHSENYMEEECSQSIMSDIKRWIEEKVQLREDKNSSSTKKSISYDSNILQIAETDVNLVISIASFLKNIQFPVNTDYIHAFVAKIDNIISRQHVYELLKKFPTLFKEESVGLGSSEKYWKYLNLMPTITI